MTRSAHPAVCSDAVLERGDDEIGAKGRVVLVGGIPIDLVFRVPRLPSSGEDVLGSKGDYFVGGGFIVLYAAYQAGVRGRFGGRVGTGPHGDRVDEGLREIGCEPIQPARLASDSTLVVVLVEPGGERTFITGGHDDMGISPEDLRRIEPLPGDVVYVSGYEFTSTERVSIIGTWLSDIVESNLVVCDLGPYGAAADRDALDGVISKVDWLCLNESEAKRLTDQAAIGAAMDALAGSYPAVGIVVRVGASGSLLKMPGTDTVRIPALPVTAVVDTNGAGDTHSGTFCAALVRNSDPIEAVWLANCAAALSVTKFGSATAPPITVSDRFAMPALLEPGVEDNDGPAS